VVDQQVGWLERLINILVVQKKNISTPLFNKIET